MRCFPIILCLCGSLWSLASRGQSVPASGSSGTAGGTSTAAGDEARNQEESENSSAAGELPAADLIPLVENNPEVMVEIKSIVAAELQQQGASIPMESVTDDQVFTQIEASKELRKTLTQFLRARGFLTDEDIRLAALRDQGGLPNNAAGAAPDFGAGLSDRSTMSSRSESNETNDGSMRAESSGLRSSAHAQGLPSTRTEPSAETRNITDEPPALRRPAPYNLRSLRDLYTQAPDSPEHLKRFGSDVFVMRGSGLGTGLSAGLMARGSAGMDTLDVPIGPDYVLGPGDELSITIWGGVSENLLRAVNREGGIALPEAGLVQIAGMTMEKAQQVIQSALEPQYRNAHVAVTVARLRTIRVFVVGDVQRPGSYEISSLASPVNALYAAGGPTAVGSLRLLRHFRNNKLIGEIDLYDFMLHGVHAGDSRIQSGDTLLVPPVGTQIAVFGAVKRPAIYELRQEKTLADVVEDAGGLTVAAAVTHITVDRVVANQQREEIGLGSDANENPSVTVARLAAFDVKDGDRIHIATVLPSSERVVYLQGHVARPGRIAYQDNMRISEVLRSYGDLLPEPAETGEIVRLVAPDMHPETLDFSVSDALIGNSAITLQPFDTIRVFGRYEQDPPTAAVRGEIQRPGNYPLFEGMTAAQLVRAAGGFKRDALLERADLTSYQVLDGVRVSVSRRDLPIGAAVLKDDRTSDVELKPGDVLTIHQLTGWNDIGASIDIEGEVGHPGSYGFQEGERLSDLLRRAGGFRDSAYPQGAVLTRPEVAALEQKSREQLIRQIETSSAAARLSPGVATSDQGAELLAIQQQQEQMIAQLKSEPATGRLVIHISQDIESWAGTAADIEVRRGDVLRIPKRPGFVLVSGQVYNASAITYAPHKTAEWYLQRAGGATRISDQRDIFVIRANGEVIGRRSGSWYEHDVLSTKLDPGDTVVVPQKIIGASLIWKNLLATAQVAASVAIAAGVVAGL